MTTSKLHEKVAAEGVKLLPGTHNAIYLIADALEENAKRIDRIERALKLLAELLGITASMSTLEQLTDEKEAE